MNPILDSSLKNHGASRVHRITLVRDPALSRRTSLVSQICRTILDRGQERDPVKALEKALR
jgi:hypothetical protein